VRLLFSCLSFPSLSLEGIGVKGSHPTWSTTTTFSFFVGMHGNAVAMVDVCMILMVVYMQDP
jgi:hypothetical protein